MLLPPMHHMVVRDRRVESSDVISLILERLDGRDAPRWQPGSHIDVMLENGLTRQYSLSSDPADRTHYRIGVLRERDSRGGSEFIHRHVHAGTQLRISSPRNNFPLRPSHRYRFIAGGIGITPILPMVAQAQAAGAEWALLYGGRTRDSMAYLDQLETYGDRVTIAPQDEVGHLPIARYLDAPRDDEHVYVCGPEALLQAVHTNMVKWPADSLHLERFAATRADTHVKDHEFIVECVGSDTKFTVPVGRSILDVAESHGLAVHSSCGEGVCGTCQTTVLRGSIEHRDLVLSEAERAQNSTMLICVSRAESGCESLLLEL